MSATASKHFAHHLRRFKLITFDVTDTLLAFRRPPELEYAAAVERLGYGAACAQTMRPQFRREFRRMSSKWPNFGRDARDDGQLTWENWWRRLIAGVLLAARPDLDASACRRIADHLIDRYETEACWQRTPGVDALLGAVRLVPAAQRPALGVISNFDPRLKWLLENVGLREAFDFVIASYEVGAEKPDARIFDVALALAPSRVGAVSAEEALHVGNTPQLDYVGARAAGWSSVLITNRTSEAGVEEEKEAAAQRWRTEGVAERHVFGTLAEFRERLEREEEMKWD